MTSKEALERLLKIAYVEPGPTKEKFITYEREIEHNKTCSDLYNAIKQDLDLLQGFKDNHHSMEKRNIELTTENEKLKKVIEILKDNVYLEFDDENNAVRFKRNKDDECDYTIIFVYDKEQYDLLKEVIQ